MMGHYVARRPTSSPPVNNLFTINGKTDRQQFNDAIYRRKRRPCSDREVGLSSGIYRNSESPACICREEEKFHSGPSDIAPHKINESLPRRLSPVNRARERSQSPARFADIYYALEIGRVPGHYLIRSTVQRNAIRTQERRLPRVIIPADK